MTQPLAAIVQTQSCFAAQAPVVARRVCERFAHLGVVAKVPAAAAPDTSRYLLEVDGLELMVIYTGKPIEEDLMKEAAQSLFEDEFPPTAHRDRAIVTPLHPVEGHAALLRAALAILQVAYVLTETDEANAVYWFPNGMLMSAAFFRQTMDIVGEPGDLPIPILCRFIPVPDGEGVERCHRVAVLGLHPFIGRDMEFAPSALPVPAIVRLAWDSSAWLLHKGPVFEDGDTCGGSATEIIHIRHVDRGQISPHPVYALTIEQLDRSDQVESAGWSN